MFHTHHHAHTQAQHANHANHSHNTHHAFMFDNVYSCTNCGRKGHLAKFCYDRLNVSNNHVWVRNTNILGPKKIWVAKSITTLNDIGTHQEPRRERWYHDSGCS